MRELILKAEEVRELISKAEGVRKFKKVKKHCSNVSTCDNYINCNCEFQLASINCCIYIYNGLKEMK